MTKNLSFCISVAYRGGAQSPNQSNLPTCVPSRKIFPMSGLRSKSVLNRFSVPLLSKPQGQRASALRFGDARVQGLFAVLLLLCLQLEGFCNRQLWPLLAQMLGLEESNISAGRVSYELRRLRLHGLIERIEATHRYRLTPEGLRTVAFYQRTYARIIRPGLSVIPSTSCA